MKKILENQFAKPLNERDLIEFFNLIASLHMPESKPNERGPKAAQKSSLET